MLAEVEYDSAHDRKLQYPSEYVETENSEYEQDKEEQMGLITLSPSPAKRNRAITGFASDVIRKRNVRITDQSVKRLAKYLVPFQIASTVGISLSLVDTILADREILRTANLSFIASALALQGYMIYREVTAWLMYTIPLMRGQIRT